MLTDHQIEDLAKKMNIPLAGVYFKDELPKIETNKTYIINLQDSETDGGDQNGGTHWVMLQVNKTPNGTIEPFYFDSYGQPPPEILISTIKKQFKKYLPYTTKDIQSLMNNACGFYCLALSHFINYFKGRTGHFYKDIDDFLDLFDDLNKSIDWKKNEYILKHFFQSEDPTLRKPINTDIDNTEEYKRIVGEDTGSGIDLTKIPVNVKYTEK